MKAFYSCSINKIILIIIFFALGNSYSQKKVSNKKTLFGVPVKDGTVNPKTGIIRCGTVEYEKFLQAKNPKRLTEKQFEAWLTPLVNKQKAMRTTSQSGGIITIPVVVHVIYNGQAIGVAPNITDAQVLSQIKVLNEDFRKAAGTPGSNTNPVGADTQIQFALAQVDPNGNPTNGVDRVSFCQDGWAENEINTTVKPKTIWDPTQYLNMWTVQFADSELLGYAQYPDGTGLEGLETSGGTANTDGVVSRYNVFGSRTYDIDNTFLLQQTYDRGRTMTHEVGHWLGLRHIWGDGDSSVEDDKKDCSASDYCADTPQVGYEHYSCGIFDTCPLVAGNDMPENYMDYTPDACMNIFTQNQKDRITTIINNAARRSTLKTSNKNSPIALFANDAELKMEASCDTPICGASSNQTIQKIIIYNRGTSTLTSASIKYTINGNTRTINWTGSLVTHESSVISIAINSDTNGTFNATIEKANGITDQRATNNSVSGPYIIPTSATNYTYTNYIYRLQQDNWGSETTWDLKDISGTILYSGGPYTDTETTSSPLPDLITENWTLDNNKCYTFTINDTEGDGVCCDGGKGYYDIKASDGTLITSGKSFKSTEKYTFTIGSLDNNIFETSSDIYLYPNPTNDIINILIPNIFGLPNSFTISNALGQKIIQKEVATETDLILNTSSLSNDIYFITIVKNNQKRSLRFIKE